MKTAAVGAISFPDITGRLSGSKELIKPEKLSAGDTIALTAPAGIVYDDSEFDRMKLILESFGLNVVFGEFVRERYGYFAGTDHQRALDLNRFFENPDIKAIVAVRGGWGTARILPLLDFEMIKQNPKIYCGFSDNTTLHLALLKYCSLVSFHGPNGTSDWTDLTKSSFKNVLMEGRRAEYRSNSKVSTLVPGIVDGRLIGGNLSILTSSLGTRYQPETDGAILFVEDIGEEPYKIDRMLTHLKEAGLLEGIRGFIFGSCTNCTGSGTSRFSLREVLLHHIRPLGVPSMMNADIGHDPDNFTIPMGIEARLDAINGIFTLRESAVI